MSASRISSPVKPGLGSVPIVPCLPENAPFTPEQRAYLNGFLAGLFSRVPGARPENAAPGGAPAPSLQPLTILFGSQTGNAEKLAKRIAREAGKKGFAPTVHDMGVYPTTQLSSERNLLIVASTYGDGDPPDNARGFWEFLQTDEAPKLPHTRFSICALGDSSYPKFCAFGRKLEERFVQLDAIRVQERTDCDVDFESPFAVWLNRVLPALINDTPREPTSAAAATPLLNHNRDLEVEVELDAEGELPGYDRQRPVPIALLNNRLLNGPGSAKETRHFEFSLEEAGLTYSVGDAFGVWPQNCPELTTQIIEALHCTGDEPVTLPDRPVKSLREALLSNYEITRIPQALLENMAKATGDPELTRLVQPDVNGQLTSFLRGREIIDLLLAFPGVRFAPDEFIQLLRRLAPRLYSIASSPKAHAQQIHLCISIVRYQSLGRRRQGVCSSFLADRVPLQSAVSGYIHCNPNFRLPLDPAAPMIMVGPGTGIAPFRAFLHERRAIGATGKHWLFFGDQHAASDFLYRDELQQMHRDGLLARLDTAFSRDQEEKIYVQQRMLEQANEFYAWLEAGAYFYVCGDATRMAKDVDAALHQVIQTAGARTSDQAAEYVAQLKKTKRYQRDVY